MTPRPRLRPSVTPLEPRCVPAVFAVLNLGDSGPDSLRDCLGKSNATPGADVILFQPGLSGTITLASEIAISESVTITGPGAGVLTVSGNNATRIFRQESASSASVKTLIEGLSLSGGTAQPVGVITFGGAIFAQDVVTTSDDVLTVRDCVLTGNSAARGGAIATQGCSLTLERCTLANNTASDGGAVWANRALVIEDSTLSANTAAQAGGALLIGNGNNVRVERTTLSGNTANGVSVGVGNLDGGGGAVGFQQAGGLNNVFRNCTISGNAAPNGPGGGIGSGGYFGPSFTLENCTITNNSAKGAGGIFDNPFKSGNGGIITLTSTILSGNTDTAGTNEDLFVRYSQLITTTSLLGAGAPVGKADATTKALLGNAPLLAPLANNGGPTLTHLPLPGSPAMNNGSNPAGLSTDQRGGGFGRITGSGTDIGAVEVQDQTFVVTNLNDAGPGSLRQALLSSNASGGTDTVTFQPGLTGTIKLASGEIPINDITLLTGPGASVISVSGNNANRIFNTSAAKAGTFIGISGLTLTGGNTATVGGGGAALLGVDETIDFTNCVVTGNQASFFGGAVLLSGGGILTADHCTFTNNTANIGGAVAVTSASGAGFLTLRFCSVSGNKAASSGGGGVYVTNFLRVENSTISGNSASSKDGGGLLLAGNFTTIPSSPSFTNSTISGNTAAASGGGIALVNFSGQLNISHSTVTANAATTAGGGIARVSGTGTLSMVRTIVSGNVNASSPDVSTGNVFASYCAIGSGAGSTVFSAVPFGTNLKLGPLANNGGPTMTHALLAGSPCIDFINNPSGDKTDQRGPGFLRTVNGKPDIGAFEVQPPPAKVTAVQVNDGATQRSRFTSLKVTFDNPALLPANPATAFTLKRQSDNAAVTLAGSVAGNSVTLTFTGGPLELGSLADGRYTLTARASQIFNLDGDGNGVPGDDFVLVGTPANGLFRLFGDADGDGDVDAVDYGAFRAAFGGTGNLAFDTDGDGDVDAVDFGAFRQRFGSSV